MFKIATWNVNSLRVRFAQLTDWLNQHQPDVIALQETKILDENFPSAELSALGYHAVFSGQKTYNGVAILSRHPIANALTAIPGLEDPQRRILLATINNIHILNLYVPNGSSVGSEKYSYKLDWMTKVAAHLDNELHNLENLIIVGDFNVAPEDRDVHDPKIWEGQVLVSDPERQALKKIIELGFYDTFRNFEHAAGHFTWWDYRAGAFRRNHGLRIDHILTSKKMLERCKGCYIDMEPRRNEQPSDHVPVVALFDHPVS